MLKCEQMELNTVFVATMDRLDEPSVRMVESLKKLKECESADSAASTSSIDSLRSGIDSCLASDNETYVEMLGEALFVVAGGSNDWTTGVDFLRQWAYMSTRTR